MAARPAQADALGPWPSAVSRTERRHGGPTGTSRRARPVALGHI